MRGVGNCPPLRGNIMPTYEYECGGGHRFEQRHSMDDRHNASCPMCKQPVRLLISLSDYRIAEPITIYQDLGGGRGYKEIGWQADSGVSPKQGEPYKTAKEVEREEYAGVKEV